jgi:hypothetical protein
MMFLVMGRQKTDSSFCLFQKINAIPRQNTSSHTMHQEEGWVSQERVSSPSSRDSKQLQASPKAVFPNEKVSQEKYIEVLDCLIKFWWACL